MQTHERPMIAFRRRLLRLIDEQFEGRYTALAHRAGIPISTSATTSIARSTSPAGNTSSGWRPPSG